MKKEITLLALTVSFLKVVAQDYAPAFMPSSNASFISSSANVPVSYYTGKAGVSIPLFNTTQRGIPFTVNLSYDTSGIVANSLPSWTGHGWSLNAGGLILRSVRGDYDEHSDSWNDTIAQKNLFHSFQIQPSQTQDDGADHQPDVFYFSFMGKSGHFFLGNDGMWKVSCNENIIVDMDINYSGNYCRPFIERYPQRMGNTYQPKTIKGFTMIDESGTRYVFGWTPESGTNAIEYSMNLFVANDGCTEGHWNADAWYLSEVRDRFGNLLYQFSYERDKFLVQMANDHEKYFLDEASSCELPDTTFKYPSMSLNAPVFLRQIKTRDNTMLEFVRRNNLVLTSTDFYGTLYAQSGGYRALYEEMLNHVVGQYQYPFYYLQSTEMSAYQNPNNHNKMQDPLASMGMSPLSSISIYSNGNIQYWYDFDYTVNDSTRLRLDSVCIRGLNGNMDLGINGCYKFTYYRYSHLPVDYLTEATDHWGYYNQNFRADSMNFHNMWIKDPDHESTMYGMLTDLQYPTGGVMTISYEQNTYNGHVSPNRTEFVYEDMEKPAGGLRVKRIAMYEDESKTKLLSDKQYEYNNGQLFAKPCYYWTWHMSRDTIRRVGKNVSVVPLSNSYGIHVGYSNVTEHLTDGSRVEYAYSNFSDYLDEPYFISYKYDAAEFTPDDHFSDRGFARGKLLAVRMYDSDDFLHRSMEYTYRDINELSNAYVECMDASTYKKKRFTALTGGRYKLYYPKYDIIAVTETTRMNQTNPIESEQSVVYIKKDTTLCLRNGQKANIRKMLSEQVERGQTKLTRLYTYNLHDTTMTHSFFLPLTSMMCYTNGEFTRGVRTVYSTFDAGQGQKLPKYEIAYHGSTSPDTIRTYNRYSNACLLENYTDESGRFVELLWNDNDKPLAQVINPIGDIAYRSFTVGNQLPLYSSETGGVYGDKPSDATYCTYNNLGQMTSLTKANKQTTYFEYDNFNRVTKIEDANRARRFSFSYWYRTSHEVPVLNF